MVRATQRTILSMNKGLIDQKEPKAFPFIELLSKNKHYNTHELVEHIKNMSSLQRRLKRLVIGKIQDRKKNPYDTIAYPALFFRNKDNCQDLLCKTGSNKKSVFFY